jgi:WD40 repeat protein
MVLRVCYDSTGHFLIVALNDGYLMKYDAEQGGMLLNFKASDVSLTGGISFTPDDSRIVTRSSRRWSRKHDSILVWDGMSRELLSTFAGHHTDSIKQISVCPVGNLIASAAWDKTVVILDSTNGAQISRLDGHTDLVYAVAYNADGTLLASAAADRTVRFGAERPMSYCILSRLQKQCTNCRSVAMGLEFCVLTIRWLSY